MAKLSVFKSDVKTETDGVWVQFAEGIEFRIARLGNPQFKQWVARQVTSRKRGSRIRQLDMKAIEEVHSQAMAKFILLDWKNIEDDKGDKISYSTEFAYELLTDPAYREIREFVETVAQDAESFKIELDEHAEGNFANASAGS